METWKIAIAGALLAVLAGSFTVGAVKPVRVVAPVGEPFTLDIVVENVSELYGWQVGISYDPSVLEVVGVQEGSLLKQGGQTLFVKSLDSGEALIGCSLLGDTPGVSGSGILATITFVARDGGTSGLNFVDTLLLNRRGESLGHQTVGGAFQTPDSSSPAPTPQVGEVQKDPAVGTAEPQPSETYTQPCENQSTPTEPEPIVIQSSSSVALAVEVAGEQPQPSQTEQQPVAEQPVQETQPAESSPTPSDSQPVQVDEGTDVQVAPGTPVVYLTVGGA